MKENFVAVMVTASDVNEGAELGKAVVAEKLAACCNVVPGVRSIYRWKDEIFDEGEVLCIMKTRSGLFERLKERVLELHSYDVPEITAVAIDDGHSAYLDWVAEVTEGD